MSALVRQMVASIRADDADFLAEAAERIKTRMRTSIVEVGRDLLAVKAMLPHGEFGPWLSAEFDMTERAAQRYMGAARLADTKSDTVSLLPAAALYELASPSTPAAAQDRIIGKIAAGETVLVATVKEAVKEAKAEERVARLTPEELKANKEREKRRRVAADRRLERSRVQQEEWLAERREKAGKVAALLRDRLGDDVEKLRALMVDGVQWNEVEAALRGGSGEATP